MALPDKNQIHPDLLYLFVIGPGTGETVLVRIPPDQWVIIDSFRYGKPSRPAAQAVVSKYGGAVSAIVLTHPHRDHYMGVIDLIDNHRNALLACVHPRESVPGVVFSVDPMSALKSGAKPVYTRIWDEWTANVARRWETFRSSYKVIADATVTSLHPASPRVPADWSNDLNEISSAMFVEWHGLRLLLGADVPNSQWPDIASAFPQRNLGDHAAMKVPHHGSREAIHTAFGVGPRTRTWVVTPFGGELPSENDLAENPAEGPEGLAKILSFVDEVHLTALPFRHDREADAPCVTTRQEIRDDIIPRRIEAINDHLKSTTAALDRYVIVGFDRSGVIQQIEHGPGSVRVHN